MKKPKEIKERISINYNYIKKYTYEHMILILSILGTIFTLLPIGTDMISIKMRIIMIVTVVILVILFGGLSTFFKKSITVKNNDNKKIKILYGDLIKLAFKQDSDRKIIVIPVNRCFDTIVDDEIIESGSVHGQWVKNYLKLGISIEELNAKISLGLKDVTYQELSKQEKPKGKRKRYPLGTVVEIKGRKNTLFYLLALTEFDDNLTANCNRAEYFSCLQYLIEYYNCRGLACPLYMPTMGCGFARLNLNLHEAVEAIAAIWKINSDKMLNDINIVVYEKQKNVLAITDFEKM